MNFGGRIKAEREARGLSQRQLATLAGMEEEKGQQTISILERRDSKRSDWAAQLARALGVRIEYALTGQGEKYLTPSARGQGAEGAGYVAAAGTGLLDATARTRIGSRIFSEIKRTGRTPADVAARLRMTLESFEERARAGDLSLEDLAEIVLYLGSGASLDFIVLGRFPTGDTFGPGAQLWGGVRKEALADPQKRKKEGSR